MIIINKTTNDFTNSMHYWISTQKLKINIALQNLNRESWSTIAEIKVKASIRHIRCTGIFLFPKTIKSNRL